MLRYVKFGSIGCILSFDNLLINANSLRAENNSVQILAYSAIIHMYVLHVHPYIKLVCNQNSE